MSEQPAAFEASKQPPLDGGDPLARPRQKMSLVTRLVRALLRLIGILVLLAMGAFLAANTCSSVPGDRRVDCARRPGAGREDDGDSSSASVTPTWKGGSFRCTPASPAPWPRSWSRRMTRSQANAALLRLDDRAARFRVEEAKAMLDKALAQLARSRRPRSGTAAKSPSKGGPEGGPLAHRGRQTDAGGAAGPAEDRYDRPNPR